VRIVCSLACVTVRVHNFRWANPVGVLNRSLTPLA